MHREYISSITMEKLFNTHVFMDSGSLARPMSAQHVKFNGNYIQEESESKEYTRS
jgi:hypothetical protein